MALGRAAGVAAHLAIGEKAEVRRVPMEKLQTLLKEQGQGQVIGHE